MKENSYIKKIHIYTLSDPRSDVIRYVGKTSGPLKTRLSCHVNDVKRGRTFIPRHKWLKELLDIGIKPIISSIEVVPEEVWQESEKFWIKYFRNCGYDLLNATSGGDGLSTYKHREDTKVKQSISAKKRYLSQEERQKTGDAVREAYKDPAIRQKLSDSHASRDPNVIAFTTSKLVEHARSPEGRAFTSKRFKGRKHTEETKKKMSLASIGRKRSPEAIRKCAEGHIGKKHSEETKAKMAESRRLYYQNKRRNSN